MILKVHRWGFPVIPKSAQKVLFSRRYTISNFVSLAHTHPAFKQNYRKLIYSAERNFMTQSQIIGLTVKLFDNLLGVVKSRVDTGQNVGSSRSLSSPLRSFAGLFLLFLLLGDLRISDIHALSDRGFSAG